MPEHTEDEARVGLLGTAPVATFNGNSISEWIDPGEEVALRIAWPQVEEGYVSGPVNSAGVEVDTWEGVERVLLHVSLGDPRGRFVMKLEHDPATGELRLSVPTPEDPQPHEGLVPLASPGYYRVTSYEESRRVLALERQQREAVEHELGEARRALEGDSNDAEHDALVGLAEVAAQLLGREFTWEAPDA